MRLAVLVQIVARCPGVNAIAATMSISIPAGQQLSVLDSGVSIFRCAWGCAFQSPVTPFLQLLQLKCHGKEVADSWEEYPGQFATLQDSSSIRCTNGSGTSLQ